VAGFAHKPKKNMENSTKKKSDGILLLARRYTPLQKIRKFFYFIYPPIFKSQEVKI